MALPIPSVLSSNRIAFARGRAKPPPGYFEISNPIWQMIFRASDVLTRTNKETQQRLVNWFKKLSASKRISST
uniref:Uncharacterized protein n=1 Tax=Plectus sambesii TaxID=2011161 RepID=A0A914V3U6_9BILA